MMKKANKKPTIGWREWAALPELGIAAIKAKVDTGARTSAIHAIEIETIHRHGKEFVRFKIHPTQYDSNEFVEAEAEVVERRLVRSSSGHQSPRPVIRTTLTLANMSWQIELTLAGRDEMGFRMLLGRNSLEGKFVIDPGRSYVAARTKLAPRIGEENPVASPLPDQEATLPMAATELAPSQSHDEIPKPSKGRTRKRCE